MIFKLAKDSELLEDMDKAIDRTQRRYERLLAVSRRNPDGFRSHVEKVLSKINIKDFEQYRSEILRISKRTGDDFFKRHSKFLTKDEKGFYVFLRLFMEELDYTIIASQIGVDINKLINLSVHVRFPEKFAIPETNEESIKMYRTISTDTHKAPNDKITISLFNPKKKQWEQGKFLINENPNGRERVITPVDMKEMGLTPFNSFDRIVFNTCYSLMAAGNLATTTDVIFSHMTGKDRRPTEEMRRKIKDSIIKVSSPWIRVDVESANDAFHYGKKKIYEGRLLYAKFEQFIINGNTVDDGITFWGKSPLVEIAEIRNQILSFPKELLNVPVSATEETIVMRGELLRAVMGIVNHGLTPTILFSTVFSSIGYNEMDKQQQQRTRKKAALMMDTWQRVGLFKSYTVEKEGQTPVKFVIACKGKPRKVKG